MHFYFGLCVYPFIYLRLTCPDSTALGYKKKPLCTSKFENQILDKVNNKTHTLFETLSLLFFVIPHQKYFCSNFSRKTCGSVTGS